MERSTEKKEVVIIGSGDAKPEIAALLAEKKVNAELLTVDQARKQGLIEDHVLEIDGIEYREAPKPKVNSRMAKILLMAQMMGGGFNMKEPERPDVDIVSEYRLIQKKKSNLSSRQRAWVVSEFHRKYIEIT